jgi:hypothetical protein
VKPKNLFFLIVFIFLVFLAVVLFFFPCRAVYRRAVSRPYEDDQRRRRNSFSKEKILLSPLSPLGGDPLRSASDPFPLLAGSGIPGRIPGTLAHL